MLDMRSVPQHGSGQYTAEMQTASTDNLFQTDAEIEKAAARQAKSVRTAELGWPMRLSSKPLDLAVRYQDGRGEAWTAESGFLVRRLDLEVGLDWEYGYLARRA